MNAAIFREQLRAKLEKARGQVLLRILLAPDFDTPVELKGGDILERGRHLAMRYLAAPKKGVVLLLLPHSPELFLLHLGLVLEGYLPAILAWPTSRIDPEKYQRNLLHQLANLPAVQLITLARLAENLRSGLPYPATACEVAGAGQYELLFSVALEPELEKRDGKVADRPAPNTDDALFLQFSGGTTGVQKSVVVTAPMLANQLALLGECLALSPNDSVVSWLPLYHDMGLIACLWFPLWHGLPSLHLAAGDWVLNPELMIRHISRFRGTLCWLPNFAFSYLADRREKMSGLYDLSSLRAWINCSEPVRQNSMQRFARAFSGWGVRETALQASYAMAENTFAVTQTRLDQAPQCFPRSAVRSSPTTQSQPSWSFLDEVYVSSGRPLPGMEVRIVDGDGQPCQDGTPGDIQIRTPSLFRGYWGPEGFLLHSLTPDGFHATGDYGFLSQGELFVVGRIKDIIIIGGQNVFPEDVESVVNSVPGIYPGRVVAFGVEDQQYGTQALAVVAELKDDYTDAAARSLEKEVRKLVLATIAIAPRFVAIVPQRWIVKSTAGKISRRDTRDRFLREKLPPLPTQQGPDA